MVAVVTLLGGLAAVVIGVLVGGFFGVLTALAGFGALVTGGVTLVRSSRESLAAQIQEIASRYQGPAR